MSYRFMINTHLLQLNTYQKNTKAVSFPKDDDMPPVSASEKLVKADIEKLSENTNEIKRLKEQIKKDDKSRASDSKKK